MEIVTSRINFKELYAGFNAAVTSFDCGERCAPFNDKGVPFCCDPQHVIPSAYEEEWRYLQDHTGLWQVWQTQDLEEFEQLHSQLPEGQRLIACQGYQLCQRSFRTMSCRAFPFFPYLTSKAELIGLTYYWEYRDRCWLISHLNAVTQVFRIQFMKTFSVLFNNFPYERKNFLEYSSYMRDIYQQKREAIPLLCTDGSVYKISPKTEAMRRTDIKRLPKFGIYKIAFNNPFPGEFDFYRTENDDNHTAL
jgi:hypothetical protein